MSVARVIPDSPRSATPEEVWALIREVAENQRETDRQLEKTKKLISRNGKQMGELHQRFGKLAEHLVAPGIVRRFNELGFKFERIADGNLKLLDEQGRIKAEIDLLLENGDYIIAIEVKVKPVLRDIDHHKKRLEILREDRNKHNDQRKILGGIAGAIFEKAEKAATLEAGMYVLEQSGDTMKIDIPEGFVPYEY
jgi:predicted AAA+ superfamily ATPase